MADFTFYTDAARSTTFNAITFPELNLFVEPLLADQAQAFDTADVHLFKSTYDKTKGIVSPARRPATRRSPGAFATWSSWIDDEGEVGFEETRGKLVEGTLPPATPGTPQKWLLKLGRPYPDPDTGLHCVHREAEVRDDAHPFPPRRGQQGHDLPHPAELHVRRPDWPQGVHGLGQPALGMIKRAARSSP